MPRFQNLEPPHLPPPIGRVLRWAVVDKLAGRRRAAPSRCEMPVVEHDAALLRSDAPSCTWVGHATWVVRLAGCTILTDPVWSKSLGPTIRRNVAPGVPEADLSPDIVLVSHNHRDHLEAVIAHGSPPIRWVRRILADDAPTGPGAAGGDW